MKYSLLLCLLLFAGTTCAFSDTIFVSPTSHVTVGQMLNVVIEVDNIPDLYAYQFTLLFNPTVLAADSITEGTLFADTNNSFFLPGTIDNTTGSIANTADTLLSPPGVSGPGTLAIADFTAIGAGTASISFDPSSLLLLDSSLNQISVTTISGTTDVADAPAAEPATVCLLALALGLMIFGKRRRSKRAVIVARPSKRQLKGGAAAFNF